MDVLTIESEAFLSKASPEVRQLLLPLWCYKVGGGQVAQVIHQNKLSWLEQSCLSILLSSPSSLGRLAESRYLPDLSLPTSGLSLTSISPHPKGLTNGHCSTWSAISIQRNPIN